jgi:hypothetical protein
MLFRVGWDWEGVLYLRQQAWPEEYRDFPVPQTGCWAAFWLGRQRLAGPAETSGWATPPCNSPLQWITQEHWLRICSGCLSFTLINLPLHWHGQSVGKVMGRSPKCFFWTTFVEVVKQILLWFISSLKKKLGLDFWGACKLKWLSISSTSQRFGHTYSFKGFSLFFLFSTL